MKNSVLALLAIGLLLSIFLSCSNDTNSASDLRLLGTWHISAIHNSSPSGPTLGPNEGELITLNFAKNGSLSGNTPANTFGGNYSTTFNNLRLKGFFSTEVAEGEFGSAFFGSLTDSWNAEIESSEFEMVFSSDNLLNLEYQGFKFLTLQKQ